LIKCKIHPKVVSYSPDVHFDNSYPFSDAHTEKFGNPKHYYCKDKFTQTKCPEMELNPSKDIAMDEGDNPSI
jgi:hypothetical protein